MSGLYDEDGIDGPFNKAMDAAIRQGGPLAPVIVPVRDAIAGKAIPVKRTGDIDNCLGGRNWNHVRWCRTFKYAGNPDARAEIVAFHERELREGQSREEPLSRSHEIQQVAPVLCNIALALPRDHHDVLDASAVFMREWLTLFEKFMVPGHRPRIDFAGARQTSGAAGEVDQSQPIAELVTYLRDGKPAPSRNLDALDRTCLWAARQPGVMEFLRPRLQGRTDADLPTLIYGYNIATVGGRFALGWFDDDADLAACYAPARWVQSLPGGPKFGDDPAANKLSRGNTLKYPPRPPLPAGARIVRVHPAAVRPSGAKEAA